jgi:protein-S-isoprenylcysteine O-methyltransferase Ste14
MMTILVQGVVVMLMFVLIQVITYTYKRERENKMLITESIDADPNDNTLPW